MAAVIGGKLARKSGLVAVTWDSAHVLKHSRHLQAVALSRIAGLKYASMSVHTRETAFKQALLFGNDRMVPRGIERLDGE